VDISHIEQRCLHEFLLGAAGIEEGHCIAHDPEEIARRLLRNDCVALFRDTASGLEGALLPRDPDADSVGADDFDHGEGWEFVRFLEVTNQDRFEALRDCRQALAIAVSRAYADFDARDLTRPDDTPLHSTEAQLLLNRSGLPWDAWEVELLKSASSCGMIEERELDVAEAAHLVRVTERSYCDKLGGTHVEH
jgi:hypothetical protein